MIRTRHQLEMRYQALDAMRADPVRYAAWKKRKDAWDAVQSQGRIEAMNVNRILIMQINKRSKITTEIAWDWDDRERVEAVVPGGHNGLFDCKVNEQKLGYRVYRPLEHGHIKHVNAQHGVISIDLLCGSLAEVQSAAEANAAALGVPCRRVAVTCLL